MGAPTKPYAVVVTGRSVHTVLGTAHAGAKITPKMLSKNDVENAGKTAFRRLLDEGVIEYPPTKKEVIEEDSKGQLSFAEKTVGEAPKEEAPKEEALQEEAPKEEATKEEALKEEDPKEEAPKAGAKRKKK